MITVLALNNGITACDVRCTPVRYLSEDAQARGERRRSCA
jgi:hypothetical protein